MEGRKWLLFVGICFLCFFGVPIKINKGSVEDKRNLFSEYIRKFNKSYRENDTEYVVRYENFMTSLKRIEELNKNRSINQSALYGLTEYSDLSQAEFVKNRLQTNSFQPYQLPFQSSNYKHLLKSTLSETNSVTNFKKLKRSALPAKVDWREKGIIGAVRNQKTCGACWAFSTIETMEAMNAKKSGSLVELSVQEVVDCAQFGNYGCEGGDSCSLLNWLLMTKVKITTEKLYPFAYRTELCRIKKPKTGVQLQNFTCSNYVGMEDKLLEDLAFHGPVAAAINALNWQYYLGGIIQFHCPGAPRNLNHAIQIVGYDTTGPVPHYIVRNSWGPGFGDKGYLYIAIGGNICGLANEVSSLDVL